MKFLSHKGNDYFWKRTKVGWPAWDAGLIDEEKDINLINKRESTCGILSRVNNKRYAANDNLLKYEKKRHDVMT